MQAVRQSYSELEKETRSLQVVYDLRCEEVRTLRQDLEKMGQLTAQVLTLRERNHTLLNTVEGLQAQLEHKSNEERFVRHFFFFHFSFLPVRVYSGSLISSR